MDFCLKFFLSLSSFHPLWPQDVIFWALCWWCCDTREVKRVTWVSPASQPHTAEALFIFSLWAGSFLAVSCRWVWQWQIWVHGGDTGPANVAVHPEFNGWIQIFVEFASSKQGTVPALCHLHFLWHLVSRDIAEKKSFLNFIHNELKFKQKNIQLTHPWSKTGREYERFFFLFSSASLLNKAQQISLQTQRLCNYFKNFIYKIANLNVLTFFTLAGSLKQNQRTYMRYFGIAKFAVLDSEIINRRTFPAHCKTNTEAL